MEWILVSNQLPPHEEGQLYNHSSVDVLCFDGEIVRSGYYYFPSQRWVMYDYVNRPNVTHWMPLPAPPTGA